MDRRVLAPTSWEMNISSISLLGLHAGESCVAHFRAWSDSLSQSNAECYDLGVDCVVDVRNAFVFSGSSYCRSLMW